MATVSHPVTTSAAQTTATVLQPSEKHGDSEEGKDGVTGALEADMEEEITVVKDKAQRSYYSVRY